MAYLGIILPTKNEEKYLPLLLDSIKRQSLKNLEIIVADSNSSDRTREIALNERCRIVEGEHANAGFKDVAQARNTGAKASSSEVLCFIDSDIVLPHREFLRTSLREMKERGLDVAGTLLKPIPVENPWKNLFYECFYEFSNQSLKLCQYTKRPFMQAMMFVKRGVFEKLGGFPHYEFGEDSALAEKAVCLGYKFGMLTEGGRAFVSPRRFEQKGIGRMLAEYAYFNAGRIFGHEFPTGKARHKYW